MSFGRLVLRSLVHYWRTGIVVAIGLAVAAAVIVGSLVIGDSIEASIRTTALARLGTITHAVMAPQFVRAEIAGKLPGQSAAVLAIDGSARRQGSDAIVANVAVVGVDDRFWALYPGTSVRSIEPRTAIINESLAGDAGVAEGDTLLVTVSRPGDAPADTLFARRARQETLASLRVTVGAVLPDLGPAGFRLDPSTAMPRNVLVDRDWLAEQLGEPQAASALVLDAPDADRTSIESALDEAMTLGDYGLYLRSHGPWLSVFSEAVVLSEAQVEAATDAARRFGEVWPTSVYLADSIEVVGDPARSIAYAVIANLRGTHGLPLVEGRSQTGNAGIWLNEWAIDDLGLAVGDDVDLRVRWRVSTASGYENREAVLPLAGRVAMRGLGADPDLVPEFAGITDAEHIDEWEPPFPIDLSRITDRDEQYWDEYRAAPKAFVGSDLLRRMWQGPDMTGPWVTSVRIGPLDDPGAVAPAYRAALLQELAPQDAGVAVRSVRQAALQASKGTSDFAGLFLGMSMFLVFAGAALAGTLMALSAQRRAAQAGILLATGFTEPFAVRVVAAEGLALSILGVAIGAPLGILYAHAVIGALATRWQGALGNAPVLGVQVESGTVAIGAAGALLVGIIATWWGARVLSGRAVLDLLRGWRRSEQDPREATRWVRVAFSALVVTTGGLLVAGLAEVIPTEGAFFGVGGALLLTGLTGSRLALGRAIARSGAWRSLPALALRSAASSPGRSLLLVGLAAAATFVIVAVAANSRDFSRIDVHDPASGTGGFTHVATSSVELRFDPGTEEGRENLGFLPDEQRALEGTTIISLPRSPGEDISCLNVARPTHPRLLGVTDEMIRRDGFSVRTAQPTGGNPWELLEPVDMEEVPVFGDLASVQWQLHSGLGRIYEIDTPQGATPLRFQGILQGSIFQSEILVPAKTLRRLYPEIAGPTYFLVEAPEGREEEVASALRSALGEMGVQVRTTAEVLNSYIQVQNTYLTMFLALGGLGLVLGTVGMVAVVLRSAFERRSEFALMLATGFTRTNLTWLLIVENAGLLLTGVLIGTGTALVAVAPHLLSARASVNWGALLTVLGGIIVVGLIACVAGARAATGGRLIEALRTE